MLPTLVAIASAASGAHLDAGDRAWADGDRFAAREAWRHAAQDAHPSDRAMAELRLLFVSGSLGLAVHGPRADAALEECPTSDPRCLLAIADYTLVLRELGLPHELDDALEAAEAAHDALPQAATARLVWAGHTDVSALSPDADGLSYALSLHNGRWPAGPGTWLLGFGVVGAPGLGVGGSVRFIHPDLAWRGWRLDTGLTLTSRGSGSAAASVTSPGIWGIRARAWGARGFFDTWQGGALATSTELWSGVAAAAPIWRPGRWSIWAGPQLRVDASPDPVPGHGGWGGVAWNGRTDGTGPWAALSGEAALLGPAHASLSLDIREQADLPLGLIALRALGQAAPWSDAPASRLPQAGGGELLRGAPLGRWRAPMLAGAVVEWRVPIGQIPGVALFSEGAWIDGPHWGVGAGLRLHLPPQPLNTVRLDVARGDAGWALTAGWGEAF